MANGSSGYGGNLATFAETPLPGAVWLFAGGLGLIGMMSSSRKRKAKSAWGPAHA